MRNCTAPRLTRRFALAFCGCVALFQTYYTDGASTCQLLAARLSPHVHLRLRELFQRLDANRDGVVSFDELLAGVSGAASLSRRSRGACTSVVMHGCDCKRV